MEQEDGRFPTLPLLIGAGGLHSQGKEHSGSKWRSHGLKTAFQMSQQSHLLRHWSLPEARANSYVVWGFFPSSAEVDYSPS